MKDAKLEKEYKKLDKDDEITIKPTTFKQAWSSGWFDGLIVWPLATLINKVSAATDAGIGIIVTTVILQVVFICVYRKITNVEPKDARNYTRNSKDSK